ncbi:MAG: hypothetical protein MMC33_001200 [Icmadophila ericetorum]|nr:hypothetical protein [Icmadophila ericetorum]
MSQTGSTNHENTMSVNMFSPAKATRAGLKAQTTAIDTPHKVHKPSLLNHSTTAKITPDSSETFVEAWTNVKEVETKFKEIASTYNDMFIDFKLMVSKTNTLMQQNQQLLEHLKKKSKSEKALLEGFGQGLEVENERLRKEIGALQKALEMVDSTAGGGTKMQRGLDGAKSGKGWVMMVCELGVEFVLGIVLGGAVAAAIFVVQSHPLTRDDPAIQLAGPFGLVLLGIWLHGILCSLVIGALIR